MKNKVRHLLHTISNIKPMRYLNIYKTYLPESQGAIQSGGVPPKLITCPNCTRYHSENCMVIYLML